MQATSEEISAWEHKFRIRLMNSVTGFKSANLIGTRDAAGQANVAVFSSVTHYGSKPPVIGVTLRPPNENHQTYSNIKETGFYTINAIPQGIVSMAHKTSENVPREVSEFELSGLNEFNSETFPNAPFVKECRIGLGMKFLEEHLIKVNGTILVLGEIIELHVDDEFIEKDGMIDHVRAETVAVCGLDSYFKASALQRFPR